LLVRRGRRSLFLKPRPWFQGYALFFPPGSVLGIARGRAGKYSMWAGTGSMGPPRELERWIEQAKVRHCARSKDSCSGGQHAGGRTGSSSRSSRHVATHPPRLPSPRWWLGMGPWSRASVATRCAIRTWPRTQFRPSSSYWLARPGSFATPSCWATGFPELPSARLARRATPVGRPPSAVIRPGSRRRLPHIQGNAFAGLINLMFRGALPACHGGKPRK
jgi:hypothetical protein